MGLFPNVIECRVRIPINPETGSQGGQLVGDIVDPLRLPHFLHVIDRPVHHDGGDAVGKRALIGVGADVQNRLALSCNLDGVPKSEQRLAATGGGRTQGQLTSAESNPGGGQRRQDLREILSRCAAAFDDMKEASHAATGNFGRSEVS